jgi:threonine dehydratase
VIAVEPELSNALQASMAAGETVTVEPDSLADGLNGPYAGENCVRQCLDLGVENVLVTEEEIADAFRWMYGRMKLACEAAGAATAAALLSGRVELEEDDVVAAVVSGGNVAAETAAAILAGR